MSSRLFTALPPYRLTALPPYRLTALPPYRLTALPPYRLTASVHASCTIRAARSGCTSPANSTNIGTSRLCAPSLIACSGSG